MQLTDNGILVRAKFTCASRGEQFLIRRDPLIRRINLAIEAAGHSASPIGDS